MELLRTADIPLQPRPPGWPVPLTALQRYQWDKFVNRGSSLSDLRMCAVSVRLSGPLNIDLLQESIASVVQRHESLRTKIASVGGVPVQQIDPDLHDYFEFIDLTSIPPSRREAEAVLLGQEFVAKKIDIFVGPLFEAKLLKFSDQDHVLIIGLDHLVSDAISNAIVKREIFSLYRNRGHAGVHSLPPLSIQFPDYAAWEQNTYHSWRKEHEPYWRQHLSGAPRIRLTPDKVLPTMATPALARLHFPYGKTLSVSLDQIAQKERIRLPLVVLTAYVVLMSRWCKQRDVVLTIASHGRRSHVCLKGMVGMLAHPLYLRIEVGDDDSFLDVLKKVHVEFDSTRQHRDFGQVAELIPIDFTDLRFNWLPSGEIDEHQQEDDRELIMRRFSLKIAEPTQHVLPLFTATSSGINATILYRSDLFSQKTIESLGQSLRRFSAELAQDPLTRVSSVPLTE